MYERSHRESENRESGGLVKIDIANAEIVMSEIRFDLNRWIKH